ncbi:MAG: hypothetical protein ABIJ59_01990 [Pseudomonadota bacterium]
MAIHRRLKKELGIETELKWRGERLKMKADQINCKKPSKSNYF